MSKHTITIEWDGFFDLETVIAQMNDAGVPPHYEGQDYGLYQIYGKHILCGPGALLYIGIVTEETFSDRFRQHKMDWLDREQNIEVFIGRVYDPKKHSRDDGWKSWEEDIKLAERILIYKYSPHYNNVGITEEPELCGKSVRLIHVGKRHKLKAEDYAPRDF